MKSNEAEKKTNKQKLDTKFIAVVRTCGAEVWPTPDLKEKPLIARYTPAAEMTLISAPAISNCKGSGGNSITGGGGEQQQTSKKQKQQHNHSFREFKHHIDFLSVLLV